ncbi:MAG: hypothetical protein J2P51_07325 [Hyphomicrobiaceae bacterium]|nr:hypothetical protein [Hyphomicrobiaceae bacterium]
MFRKLIDYVKSKLIHAALGYAERAAVAIPFVLALGFVVAAIHAMLVDHFGGVTGNWLMAGGLVCVGVIGALAVKTSEASETTQEEPLQAVASLSRAPSALLQAAPAALDFLSSSGRPAGQLARSLWRHSPLLLLAGLISLLFYPTDPRGPAARRTTFEPGEDPQFDAEGSLTMRYATQRLLAEHAL